MKRIKSVSKTVEKVLKEYPFTRASDDALYFEVCRIMNPMCLGLNFGEALKHINDLALPKYESVSRARRKCQELNPDLLPSEEVIDERYESFKVVREYV